MTDQQDFLLRHAVIDRLPSVRSFITPTPEQVLAASAEDVQDMFNFMNGVPGPYPELMLLNAPTQ